MSTKAKSVNKIPELTKEQLAKLNALLEAGQGNIWNPKEGDILAGKLVEIKIVNTTKGKKKFKSTLYGIHDGKTKSGVWGSAVIESRFKELEIKGGDIIAIKFLGKNKNYKNYEVAKL